jgi:cytochrome c biogenesis protein CcdA
VSFFARPRDLFLEELFAPCILELLPLKAKVLIGGGDARIAEVHAARSKSLQILLQKY